MEKKEKDKAPSMPGGGGLGGMYYTLRVEAQLMANARGPEWLVHRGAGHRQRWWWAAGLGAMHAALPGSYFDRLGVARLAAPTSTH